MTGSWESFKEEGNKFFNSHKYPEAQESYTKAIELNPDNHVLYSNRSAAALRMMEFGNAISDATRCLEIEPTFVKAYFRRGSSLIALGKFEEALTDFKRCVKLVPNDKDARARLKECERVVTERKFMAAISRGEDLLREAFAQMKPEDVTVEPTYDGPVLEEDVVTLEFVKGLMEYQRNQKKLHRKYAMKLMLLMRDLLLTAPTLVDITVPPNGHITVCGDIHGQYYDLLNIFEINGLPSETNPYLFNGDFVDRGSFSVECVLLLFAFKLLYPKHFHLHRGNHETRNMNKMYGFEGEVKAKYSSAFYDPFAEVFCLLPLCSVINEKVFVVHGGLFQNDSVTLDNIRKVDRRGEPPSSGLMCDMLWSDPQPQSGRAPSKRGIGCSFGPDVVEDFLSTNSLEWVIRSHEVKPLGHETIGKCITIFSAPNYCDQVGNKGAFIRLQGSEMVPRPTSFDAVPHPEVPPMAYANPMFAMA